MPRLRSPRSGRMDRVELISSSPDGGVKLTSSGPDYPPPALYTNGTNDNQGNHSESGGPSMTERSRVLRGGKYSKGLTRFGLPKGSSMLYIDDLYHTLLNMPRYRFLASFFTVYLALYLVFSFVYLTIPAECIGGEMTFGHAFWFSVWTASTIGYSSYLAPSPDCSGINILVTFQIISAALIDTMLMSLVFSRFAAPMPRARTIRFSHNAVLARQKGSPYWALSFRLANIRKHSLMDPELTLLLAVPDPNGSNTAFRFIPLMVDDLLTQITSLKLGLPATISHIITPHSPMYDLSLTSMEGRGMEILCFMSGMDPMTSNVLQAHHPYRPIDIRMNERFVGIQIATNKRGRLGVDLSMLDSTVSAEVGMGTRDESQPVLYPMPLEDGQSLDGIRQHMQELRTRTLRSLTVIPTKENTGSSSHSLSHDTTDGDNHHHTTTTLAMMPSGMGLQYPAGLPPGTTGCPTWQGGIVAGGDPLAQSWHPLHGAGSVGDHAGVPHLPVSWGPSGDMNVTGVGSLPTHGSVGATASPPSPRGVLRGEQWDAAVQALCEAVSADGGASVQVRQRAAALRAALLALPAPQQGAAVATGNGPKGPSFDMLQ